MGKSVFVAKAQLLYSPCLKIYCGNMDLEIIHIYENEFFLNCGSNGSIKIFELRIKRINCFDRREFCSKRNQDLNSQPHSVIALMKGT